MSWNGGAQQDAEEAWFEEYQAANPNIKINAEYLSWDNYYSKLNTLIAANSCPDIFFSSEDTLISYAKKGMALDLAPYFAAEGIDMVDYYHPATMYVEDGKVYSIANGVSCMVMFYNKKLFEEKGVEPPSTDPLNPWTWDQYVDAAIALTEDSSGRHPNEEGFDPNSIVTYGTLAPTNRNAMMPLLYSNEASYFNDDASGLNLDTPEAKEVLQNVADLMLVDHVAPAAAMSKSLPAVQQMFKDNQLAMSIDGAWSYLAFKTDDIDVGIAPLPMYKKALTVAWASAYLLSSQSKNPEAAVRFLMDFIDPEKNPDQLTFMSGPALKDMYAEEKLAGWLETNDFYNEDYRKVLPVLLTETSIEGENVLVDCFSEVVDSIVMPTLEQVWLGTAGVDDAVAQCYELTADVFAEN